MALVSSAIASSLAPKVADLAGLKEEIEAAVKTFHDQLVASCVQICERRLKGESALPPDWAEHVDPATQKSFYYNSKTQETRWDKPAPLPKPVSPVLPTTGLPRALGPGIGSPAIPGAPAPAASDWAEHSDPATGKMFYYNLKTKESSWTKPAELMKPPIVAPAYGLSGPVGGSVTAAPGALPGALPAGWTQNTDPATGKTFYYNATTKESKWERPAPAPAVLGVGALPPDWTQNTDPTTGKTFYYNAKTQESKWERPAPAIPSPGCPAPPVLPKPPGVATPLPAGPNLGGLGNPSLPAHLRR
jgi:hypothetical protein